MSASIKRFLILDQGLIPGIFNFFINGGIAWWLNQKLEFMPLWGEKSIAVDTLATAFLLPLITCLIVTPIINKKIQGGSLQPLPNSILSNARLPSTSSFVRGLLAGLIGVIGIAVPVLLLWQWFGPRQLELVNFLWFKASFAMVLAMALSALIAWWAWINASRQLTSKLKNA